MEIRKVMEKDAALNYINEMKDKICGVDLDSICEEKTDIIGGNEQVFNKVVQAVMCGLVYYDE